MKKFTLIEELFENLILLVVVIRSFLLVGILGLLDAGITQMGTDGV